MGSKMNYKATFSLFVIMGTVLPMRATQGSEAVSSLCGETVGSGGDCGKPDLMLPLRGAAIWLQPIVV